MPSTAPQFTSTRLAGFPANWRYVAATPDEKDRFHGIIAELLAQEVVYGLPATQEIHTVIDVTASHIIKTWLDQAREQLQRLIKADAFLKDADPAKLRKAKEQAKAAYYDAEKALDQAKVDYMVAETALDHRTRELEHYESAESLVAHCPDTGGRAFKHLKSLQEQ
jgi:hypothetical protein